MKKLSKAQERTLEEIRAEYERQLQNDREHFTEMLENYDEKYANKDYIEKEAVAYIVGKLAEKHVI